MDGARSRRRRASSSRSPFVLSPSYRVPQFSGRLDVAADGLLRRRWGLSSTPQGALARRRAGSRIGTLTGQQAGAEGTPGTVSGSSTEHCDALDRARAAWRGRNRDSFRACRRASGRRCRGTAALVVAPVVGILGRLQCGPGAESPQSPARPSHLRRDGQRARGKRAGGTGADHADPAADVDQRTVGHQRHRAPAGRGSARPAPAVRHPRCPVSMPTERVLIAAPHLLDVVEGWVHDRRILVTDGLKRRSSNRVTSIRAIRGGSSCLAAG